MTRKLFKIHQHALALALAKNRCDFFERASKVKTERQFFKLLQRSHREDAHETFQLVLHLRDPRNGLGDVERFQQAMKWYLRQQEYFLLRTHLSVIPIIGSWRDLLMFFGTYLEKDVVQIIGDQLQQDLQKLNEYGTNAKITLVGKWAPSEKSPFQKKFKAVTKISQYMGIRFKDYRKLYLRPLRKHLNLVECSNVPGTVNYAKIPSVCLFRNFQTFASNDPDGFAQFVRDVKRGEIVLKTSNLSPQLCVDFYLSNPQETQFVELAWSALVKARKEKFGSQRTLPVIVANGSIDLSYEMVLSSIVWWTSVNECPIGNQFYVNDKFLHLTKKSLYEKVYECHLILSQKLRNVDRSITVDYVVDYVTEEITDICKVIDVPDEHKPTGLAVLDVTTTGCASANERTNSEDRDNFTKHGIKIHNIAPRESGNLQYALPDKGVAVPYEKVTKNYNQFNQCKVVQI